MLTASQAADLAAELLELRAKDLPRLDKIHAYWRGSQPHPSVPRGATEEIKSFARMSRVNICRLVVAVPAQKMVIDGFRDTDVSEDESVWQMWQANGLDADQGGLIRSALAYGATYMVVLPGDEWPVLRGCSPRFLTAAYGSDRRWPVAAIELRDERDGTAVTLYDDEAVYRFAPVDLSNSAALGTPGGDQLRVQSVGEHAAGVCPVVRVRNTADLEEEPDSEVEDIMALQDQLDETVFSLKVAERYAAFRQRWMIGWSTDDEAEAVKLSAQRLMTVDADPDAVKLGEFEQTDLAGYLDSRRATLESFGIVSQTPPHNLVGQMVNLSAEALVAAEVGSDRKDGETRNVMGEDIEQALRLGAELMGVEVSDSAQVHWKDTEARSLGQTIDALGKMVQMLGVPPQATWERIPGVTQQDRDQWSDLNSGDPFTDLMRELVSGQSSPDGIPT